MGGNYEDRIVLFLDILGFKNFIESSINDSDVFNNIYRAINGINTYVDKFGKIPFRKVTTFSDSIVISYPIDNYVLRRVFQEIRDLVLVLLEYGFVCRGGVGVGELYHNGSIVFGPAMVKAYELESKFAKVPRVIISNDDINRFNLDLIEWDLKIDDDGFAYFNIFNFYYSESGQMMYTSQFIKEKLEVIISKNINNPDDNIKSKYVWLSNKLAEVIKQKICFIPVTNSNK